MAPGIRGRNREILRGLGRIKTNLDSGVFQAVQFAGIAALTGSQQCVADNCVIWQERRDVLVRGLKELGFPITPPKATFYLWIPVPNGFTSSSFSAELIVKAGVVLTPGTASAPPAKASRAAFTVKTERLREAVDRIRKLGLRGGWILRPFRARCPEFGALRPRFGVRWDETIWTLEPTTADIGPWTSDRGRWTLDGRR